MKRRDKRWTENEQKREIPNYVISYSNIFLHKKDPIEKWKLYNSTTPPFHESLPCQHCLVRMTLQATLVTGIWRQWFGFFKDFDVWFLIHWLRIDCDRHGCQPFVLVGLDCAQSHARSWTYNDIFYGFYYFFTLVSSRSASIWNLWQLLKTCWICHPKSGNWSLIH